ncbi:MAG: fibronectin type III domain-containing protein, partial [Thermoguttaceae bacterium]|nr:fibronectin type III domain-containing protein [Thermoguttaceae bacterium]
FRVYGIDANGATLEQFYEKTFAPIALTSSATEYEVGSPITVTLSAAENASATIKWYHVTESGLVEIVSARNSLTYTPTAADYNVKVVATGTGESEGCVSEVTIATPSDPVFFSYDAAGRKANVSWDAIPGAVKYKVQISKNNGETWPNYKTGITTTTVEATGLYAGKSYGFRVYGIDANGATLEQFYEKTFAPIALTSSATEYEVGSPIEVALSAAENASATIKWYNVTATGTVEIVSARNKLSYVPASLGLDIKVVATGTGASEGCVSEVTIAGATILCDYDATAHALNVSWRPIDGAASYTLKILKPGSTTWVNYRKDLVSATTTVSGVYTDRTYGLRVYGVASNGATLEQFYETSFAAPSTSSLLLDEIFADFDGEFFEEF